MSSTPPHQSPAQRPLSPHLQIWRWHVTMAGSILHRVSGVGLVLGVLLIIAWVASLATGPDAYSGFAHLSGGWLGLIVWVGVTWAAFYHLASGIRHLIWDTGRGFELGTANLMSWLSIVFSIVGTAVFWGWLLISGTVG